MTSWDIGYPFIFLASVALVFYLITGTIYRLYFSPISSFPGPKLAALTLWYEFYYDVILGGQYGFHLRDLHARYGPIIRINPYELHVSDSTFYEKLYTSGASGEKRDKWGWYTRQFGTPGSMFSTVGHNHHRRRRAALNKFFSTQSVKRLQPLIDELVDQLVGRLRTSINGGKAIMINVAYGAFTNDVIQEYAYGLSDHCLEGQDFSPAYHESAIKAGKLGSTRKQMFWLFHFIQSLPEWLLLRIFPDLSLVFGLQYKVEKQILQVKNEPPDTYQNLEHPTLFHELLQSDLLPAYEKSLRRIKEEAMIVVGAGTLTTAWTLSVATYHLLASPHILQRLKVDLKEAIPDPNTYPSLSVLEKVPYLVAVVQEALRLSYGVSTRLQRLSPDPLVFVDVQTQKEWIIPPNTPCSMTSIFVHHDEYTFPDSDSFIPERWIQNPQLSRYLVAFSKGTRQCLGINLAYTELYICLAAIFRRFGSVEIRDEGDQGFLELYETDVSDVMIAEDAFVPLPKNDSKGIRIRVRSPDGK